MAVSPRLADTAEDEPDFDRSSTAPREDTGAAGDRESLSFLFDLEGERLTGSAEDAGV